MSVTLALALQRPDALGLVLGYTVLASLGGAAVAGVLRRRVSRAMPEIVAYVPPVIPALLTALAGATIGAQVAPAHPVVAAMLLGIAVCAAWITIVDLAVHRIPDIAVLVVLILAAGGLVVDAWDAGRWPRVGIGVLAFAGVVLVGVVIAVATPHLGLGDVKLAAALAPLPVYFGAGGVAVMSVAALAGLTACVAMARGTHRTDQVPLGPAIVYGVLFAVCVTAER